MREKYKPRYDLIQESDPARFVEAVNEALAEHYEAHGFRYDVKDPSPDGVLRCYVFWDESILEPKTAKDFAVLSGESYCCGQCPYAEWPDDKRIKYARCPIKQRTSKFSDACEWFYKQVAAGDIEPEGGTSW